MQTFDLITLDEYDEKIKAHNKPIIIRGTGEKSIGTVPYLVQRGIVPICFCDSDSDKCGKTFEFDGGSGTIMSPEQCKLKLRTLCI